MGELGLTFFDVGALLFILIFSIMGIKRGFFKEFSKLFGWLIALVGSKILAYPLTEVVYNFFKVHEKLLIKLSEIMNKVDFTSLESARKTLSDGLETITGIGPFLNGYVEDAWSITEILQSGTTSMQTELTNALMKVIEPIAMQIVQIATFTGLFIILMIIISIILSLMNNTISSLKMGAAINGLLGGVLGFIKGCFFIFIVYGAIFIVLSLVGSESLTIFMDSKLFDIIVGMKDVIPS